MFDCFYQGDESGFMCFVESDAVPATLDEALSHVQPVLVQDTLNLAGLVTSSANFLRDFWKILVNYNLFDNSSLSHCRFFVQYYKRFSS